MGLLPAAVRTVGIASGGVSVLIHAGPRGLPYLISLRALHLVYMISM